MDMSKYNYRLGHGSLKKAANCKKLARWYKRANKNGKKHGVMFMLVVTAFVVMGCTSKDSGNLEGQLYGHSHQSKDLSNVMDVAKYNECMRDGNPQAFCIEISKK